MKRICFGLLLLCAVGFLACEDKSNNNNNAANINGNANIAPSPAPSTSLSPTISTGSEVQITITISDKSGKPVIDSVVPDPADLTGGKQADWVVINRSSLPEGQDASVEIGNFKGNVTGGGMPFGTRPSNNDFYMDLIQEGTTRHDISNPSRDNGRDDTYKYTITLYQKDGTQIGILDPQIIVGIRNTKPATGTAPTPQASPTKSTPKK